MGHSTFAGHESDPITLPRPARCASVIRERPSGCHYQRGHGMLWAMQDSGGCADPPSRSLDREPGDRIWTDWPCCASCGRPRLTVCPICGAAGSQFPLAEYLAPAAPVRNSRGDGPERPGADGPVVPILLVCPQCDEAFAPSSTANVRSAGTMRARASTCGHETPSRCPISCCWSSADSWP